MSKRFLTPINLLSTSSDPTSASVGDLYFNTSLNEIKLYYNSSWNSITSASGSGSGGTSVQISDTAPSNPSPGDLWYESDTGDMFIYYDSYWVQVNGNGLPDIDGGSP